MAKWTEQELRALEDDEDQWDAARGQIVTPSPAERRGAVVSVRFQEADFQRLGLAVEEAGESLTEFIRKAALARAESYRPADEAIVEDRKVKRSAERR